MRRLLPLVRRVVGRLLRLGPRRALLRWGLARAVDLPTLAPDDIRWIRARKRRDPAVAEAALWQLVRRGGLNDEERALLRERAAGPTSGIVGWRRGAPGMVLPDALAGLAAVDANRAVDSDRAADADRAAGAEHAVGSDRRPGTAWFYWPVDTRNPYQDLLYSRFAERGLVPARLPSLSTLDRLLPALPAGTPSVLHVHWLYRVTAGGSSEAEAQANAQQFIAQIDALRARGVRLVWTVHNLLPHETDYPEVELELRRFMMRSSDVVHLMAADQEPVLADAYGVAANQVVVVPHPSYLGTYPDWMDRAGARAHLGIPEHLRVLATVGQIRPYKGYREFLRALDQVHRTDPDLRWLVAGTIRDEAGWREFASAAATHPAVLCYPSFVPPEEVQYFLRAADAAVFPYVRSLNSGAVALAASFGLPAYVSSDTRLGGLLPELGYRRFDLFDPADLVRVLADGAGSLETAEVRSAVRAHAATLRPDRVSGELADALVKALDL